MGLNKRLIDQAGGGGAALDNFEFDIVTYTGTGSTRSISSLSFQPDFVWIKARSTNTPHVIYDRIRGATKAMKFNTQSASTTINGLMSFNSNGFTLNDAYSFPWTNASGQQYVAWCYKTNNATDTNNDGSLTSTLTVSEGFSISRYNSTGTSGSTIGHGLSQAPELMIIGCESDNKDWAVYASPIGATKKLVMNSTAGSVTSSAFNNTTPTDSVFTVGSDATVNQNGLRYISFNFHSVDGYQKVGSYTGTGAPLTVTTGFEPRFVMYKSTTGATAWVIVDSARATTNPRNKYIFANSSGAEPATYSIMNFLSDGFELLDTGSTTNSVGNTYIYLAIA